jgi:hypothetical protein
MRFMMLMIPLGYESAPPAMLAARSRAGRRDDALQSGAEGRRRADHAGGPASAGGGRASVKFDTGGQPIVTDGPFAEAKEVLGGFWMIDVASRAEAIAWAKQVPGLRQRDHRDPPGPGDDRLLRRGAAGGRELRASAGRLGQGPALNFTMRCRAWRRRPVQRSIISTTRTESAMSDSSNTYPRHVYLGRRHQTARGWQAWDALSEAERHAPGSSRAWPPGTPGSSSTTTLIVAMGGPLGKTKRVDKRRHQRHRQSR